MAKQKKSGNAFDAFVEKKETKSALERLLDRKLAKGGSFGVEVERCEFCGEEFTDCRCE
jgi:hypothetical protein